MWWIMNLWQYTVVFIDSLFVFSAMWAYSGRWITTEQRAQILIVHLESRRFREDLHTRDTSDRDTLAFSRCEYGCELWLEFRMFATHDSYQLMIMWLHTWVSARTPTGTRMHQTRQSLSYNRVPVACGARSTIFNQNAPMLSVIMSWRNVKIFVCSSAVTQQTVTSEIQQRCNYPLNGSPRAHKKTFRVELLTVMRCLIWRASVRKLALHYHLERGSVTTRMRISPRWEVEIVGVRAPLLAHDSVTSVHLFEYVVLRWPPWETKTYPSTARSQHDAPSTYGHSTTDTHTSMQARDFKSCVPQSSRHSGKSCVPLSSRHFGTGRRSEIETRSLLFATSEPELSISKIRPTEIDR